MGAQTALRFALDHPGRVLALGLITPAFDPEAPARWRLRRLGQAGEGTSEKAGVEGFVEAYELDPLPTRFRETVVKVLRQRLSAHDHPLAVADALEAVPRSRPFEELGGAGADRGPDRSSSPVATRPTRVIRWRSPSATPTAIPGREARRGGFRPACSSPIAWQGGQLSKVLGP